MVRTFLVVGAMLLAGACSPSPAVTGELQLAAGPIPPPDDYYDDQLDTLDAVDIALYDASGNFVVSQPVDTSGGFFDLELDHPGAYKIHASADHLILGFLPEDLGVLDTEPFEVDGPTDVGTLTLHWQPEY